MEVERLIVGVCGIFVTDFQAGWGPVEKRTQSSVGRVTITGLLHFEYQR